MRLDPVPVDARHLRQPGVDHVEERTQCRWVEHVGIEHGDLVAGGLEQPACMSDRGQRARHRPVVRGPTPCTAATRSGPGSAPTSSANGRSRSGGVPPPVRIGRADHVEHGRGVGHRAAQHPLGGHPLPARDRRGDAAPAGLQPHQPAARGRDADRATPVAGMGHREHARGHGGGRTPTGSARGVIGVPRVPGHPVAAVLGDGDRTELRVHWSDRSGRNPPGRRRRQPARRSHWGPRALPTSRR